MNNCPKCGNPLQPGVSTCPICGTMINQANAAAPAPGAPAPAQAPVAPAPAPAAQPAPPAGVPVQPPVAPMAQPGAPVPPAPGAMPMQGSVPTPVAPAPAVPPIQGAPAVPPAPAAPVPGPAAGTPAALAAQATATAPVAPPKKKPDKKLYIIGGIIAAVIIVGVIIFMIVMNSTTKVAPTKTNPTPQPRVAANTTVSVGNYDFQRPNGWSNAESAGYVYITKDDESVVIVLNKTSTNLSNATVDTMKAAAAGQRLKDTEVTEMTIGDKKAFYLAATYNDLPVEYYYIDYNTVTVIVSVVYTKAEYKDASSNEVRNIVNTIVYNEATKAAETYNNYIYNTLIGQSIMFASVNEGSMPGGNGNQSNPNGQGTTPSGSSGSQNSSNGFDVQSNPSDTGNQGTSSDLVS